MRKKESYREIIFQKPVSDEGIVFMQCHIHKKKRPGDYVRAVLHYAVVELVHADLSAPDACQTEEAGAEKEDCSRLGDNCTNCKFT